MNDEVRIKRAGRLCLGWGIGLLVLPLCVAIFGSIVYHAIAGSSLNNDVLSGVLGVYTFLVTLVQALTTPLGAVLVGAGIVLQVLAPRAAPSTAVAPENSYPFAPRER